MITKSTCFFTNDKNIEENGILPHFRKGWHGYCYIESGG